MNTKLTTNKEDYLITLLRLERVDERISTKQLAQALNISAPSISEMLVTLQSDGYIDYLPYKGAKLTKNGQLKAQDILHSHHVWEKLLMDYLEYDKKEAHDIAHELEHIAQGDFIKRLENFMDKLK